MTDPLGQSQVLPYLCGLSKKGYKIHLISADKPAPFKKLSGEIQRICDLNNITWHPVSYSKNPPIAGTLFDIYKIIAKAKEIHKIHRFELVHCRSYISSLVGVFLKSTYHVPFLFDMRGFWVDEKVDGNIWNLKNPLFRVIFRFMKRKEKIFFREADKIVSLTQKAIPTINTILNEGNISKKIQVIPCCVDVQHFDRTQVASDEMDAWKSKLDIQSSDFIIAYLGSLSTWYLPEEMLRFFKQFKIKVPHAKFLIITTEDPAPFQQLANHLGILESSLVFTSATRKEMPSLLALCQVSIFFIKPAFSKIGSSPTKLGELFSMGIPVICNTGIGDTDELVLQSHAGAVCQSFDHAEFERCADEILRIEKTMEKEDIRKKAIELFSLEKGVESYQKIYEELLIKNDDMAHS